jgi:hypothetical protein
MYESAASDCFRIDNVHADDQGVMGGVLGGEPFIKQFNNPSVSRAECRPLP